MPTLILVKHSLPEIISTVPTNQWHLSEKGRARCDALAEKLAAYQLNVVVSSVEPKAVETAQIVAKRLVKPHEIVEGLHEHDRSNIPFVGVEQFEASVAGFFAKPRQLVFGRETADEAHARFANPVARVIEKYPQQNVAVVAHGTVITLFVARAVGLEPFAFWKRLGLPSFVVLSLPQTVIASEAKQFPSHLEIASARTTRLAMALEKVIENVE